VSKDRFQARRCGLWATAFPLAVLALAAGLAAGCGGNGDEETAEPPAATEPEPGLGATGAQLYEEHCQSCHAADGSGDIGPNLQTSSVAENLEEVMEQVRNGGGQMPPFEDTLTDEEIDVVSRHVVEEIAPQA
jgi:cytochrome c551